MRSKMLLAAAVAALAMPPPLYAADTFYKYDSLGRLTEVEYASGQKVRYSYDASGNRIRVAANTSFSNTAITQRGDAMTVISGRPRGIHPAANENDANGDALTVSGTPSASNGTATRSGNRINYVAPWPYSGSDTFTYYVSDGPTSDTGTVNVTVIMPPTKYLSGGATFISSSAQCFDGGGDYWTYPEAYPGEDTYFSFCFEDNSPASGAGWMQDDDPVVNSGPYIYCDDPYQIMEAWYCGSENGDGEDYVPTANAFWTNADSTAWVKADLGKVYRLDYVEVSSEGGTVEYSTDGSSWSSAGTVDPDFDTLSMGKQNARYVRVRKSSDEVFVTLFKIYGWENP